MGKAESRRKKVASRERVASIATLMTAVDEHDPVLFHVSADLTITPLADRS
jgi:hypothetical protein